LLRARRELARARRIPERTLLLAGDPRQPVRRISPRRWTLSGLGLGVTVGCLAALISSAWHVHAFDLRGEGAVLLVGREPAAPPAAASAGEALPMATSAAIPSLPPPPAVDVVGTGAPPAPAPEHFTVEVVNTHKIVEVVLSGPASEPSEDSYRALRHELRSMTTGAENPIDPRLIELLHLIAKRTGGWVQVLSAFRAPTSLRDTNYHTRGMAADIRVPSLSSAAVRDLAKSLGARGVGYYPTSAFVHVDVRQEPFFWTDTSGPGQHQEDQHAAYTDNAARTAPPADTPATAQAAQPGLVGADAGSPPARPPASGEDGELARGAAPQSAVNAALP
jgi:uncharacterized protein YcbK (DUF882 family)